MIEKIINNKYFIIFNENIPYLIWGIGAISIFGSLYYSEVLKYEPCTLCWWLRILLYPVAIIMSVAILRKDQKNAYYYILTLAIPAVLLSFYHSLLQWGIIKEVNLLCSATAAVSCAKPDFMLLGFITIPFLGFLASIALVALSAIAIYTNKKTAK